MGDIAQGLVLDLATFAVSAAQEVCFVDRATEGSTCGGYVYGACSLGHSLHSIPHPGLYVKPPRGYFSDRHP